MVLPLLALALGVTAGTEPSCRDLRVAWAATALSRAQTTGVFVGCTKTGPWLDARTGDEVTNHEATERCQHDDCTIAIVKQGKGDLRTRMCLSKTRAHGVFQRAHEECWRAVIKHSESGWALESVEMYSVT